MEDIPGDAQILVLTGVCFGKIAEHRGWLCECMDLEGHTRLLKFDKSSKMTRCLFCGLSKMTRSD